MFRILCSSLRQVLCFSDAFAQLALGPGTLEQAAASVDLSSNVYFPRVSVAQDVLYSAFYFMVTFKSVVLTLSSLSFRSVLSTRKTAGQR